MPMKSFNFTKAICLLSFFAVLFLFNGCSETKIQGGRLPENFSWAYGSWNVKETFPYKIYGMDEDIRDENAGTWTTKTEEFQVYIGSDYVQIMNANAFKDYQFPFIEVMPRTNYKVSEEEPDDYSDEYYEEPDEDYSEEVAAPAATEWDYTPAVDAEEILLLYETEAGYEGGILYLNRKKKTVSTHSIESIKKDNRIKVISKKNKKQPNKEMG